jgi:hypothetical protein
MRGFRHTFLIAVSGLVAAGVIALAVAALLPAGGDERTACRKAWADHLCTLYPGAVAGGESECRKSYLSACIAHCDAGCWFPYAWNRHSKNFEWFWGAFHSHSECMGGAKSALEGSDWYREPFGCAYTSTSLWRTILMNKLWGPKELVCIAKVPNELAYSPTFKLPTAKDEKEGTRCVSDLPYKATILARRAEAQDYRDCVALMWDRKHPAEATTHVTPFPGTCDDLSFEELSRADAEASRATQQPAR